MNIYIVETTTSSDWEMVGGVYVVYAESGTEAQELVNLFSVAKGHPFGEKAYRSEGIGLSDSDKNIICIHPPKIEQ